LMMAIEDTFQVTVDEGAFGAAVTVADLEALAKSPGWGSDPGGAGVRGQTPAVPEYGVRPQAIVFPFWNRSLPVRAVRRASLPTWILPLGRIFARVAVSGLEHLDGLEGPVIFAANHQSHLDTPVILDALPPRWRYRVAPAMAKEFFDAHFFPQRHTRVEWFANTLNYYLAAFFFNAFPL